MDDARQLIEDKQREIEDNALDLLGAAAGGGRFSYRWRRRAR